ncbi:hypothetical protein BH10PSE4_BH10PSE4_14240 [soil metagenome]
MPDSTPWPSSRATTILRHLRRAVPALFAALGLSGCITYETTGQSSAQVKKQIVESQFYRDSALFFPADTVSDSREIPKLTPQQARALEADLNARLQQVRAMAAGPTMGKIFGDQTPLPATTRIVLTDRNAPEASTASDGEITIDTRVIQSLLRAALVSQYDNEITLERLKTNDPRHDKIYTPAEEKIAIDVFLADRGRARRAPSRSVAGDLMAAFRDDEPGGGGLDPFASVRQSRNLSGLDVRYDSELFFLIAHEVGHIALGHFGPHPIVVDTDPGELLDDCTPRRQMEATADIYASFLISIATASNATDDFLGGFGGAKVGDGFDAFFQFAYDYAGLSTGSGGRCQNYPPPAARLETLRSFYKLVRDQQIEAMVTQADKSPAPPNQNGPK